LEERAMLTVVFPLHNGIVETHSSSGGSGLQDPVVNLIFAGNWAPFQSDEGPLTSALQSILTGPFLTGLEQYGASGTAQLGQVWNDPSQATLQGPTIDINNSNLQTYLANSISTHSTDPAATDTYHAPIYVVIMDPIFSNLPTTGTFVLGFNVPGAYQNPLLGPSAPSVNIHMIEVGTFNNGGHINQDALTTIFSHELAERVTNNRFLFNNPSDGSGGDQVSDGEQNIPGYNYRLNGSLVQAYWSDNEQAAIVPDVNYPSSIATFTLAPNWTSPGPKQKFNGNYSLLVNAGGQPVTISSLAGTASTQGSISVSVGGETATFGFSDDPLTSITVNGSSNLIVNGVSSPANTITAGKASGQTGVGVIQGAVPTPIFYSYASTSSVEINTQGSGATINLKETGVPLNIVCGSLFSGTTVNIGDSTGVQGIARSVTISGFGVSITLNDSTDPSPSATYYVENEAGTPGWGDVRGLAPGQINYQYEFTAGLTVNTDSPGANVLETGVPTTIQGQAGVASTVQVGDNSGTQSILGALSINGPSNLLAPNPAATITIDDTNDPHVRTIQVENSTTPGFTTTGEVAGIAPANIYYQYWNTVSVTINTGKANNNTVDVLQDGVTTNVNSFGSFTSNVNLGDANGVQDLLGGLNIGSNPAYSGVPQPVTSINIDDTGDTSAQSITLGDNVPTGPTDPYTVGFISGLAPASIHYLYGITTSLSLVTDAVFGNTINVQDLTVDTYLVGDAVTYISYDAPGGGPIGQRSLNANLYVYSLESGTPDSGNMFITLNDLASAGEGAKVYIVDTTYPKKELPGATRFVNDSPWGQIIGVAPGLIHYEYADTTSVLIDGNSADQLTNNQDQGVNATPVYLNAFPVITSISPASGPLGGGTVVTIHGTSLDVPGRLVDFGNNAGTIISDSPTEIQVRSPAGKAAGTVDVRVKNLAGKSATSPADQFNYLNPPIVAAISPMAGPLAGGNGVVIAGDFLGSASAVDFGNNNPGTIISDVQAGPNSPFWVLTATAPAGAIGTVDVTVTTPGGTSATSSADNYTYTSAPVVRGVSANNGGRVVPPSGPLAGGTTVYIYGVLNSVTEVDFGPNKGTIVAKNGDEIEATSPAGAAGAVDVTVVNAGGRSATSANDKFTYIAAPVLIAASTFPFSAVTPDFGPFEGGTAVTITGANLTGATKVNFGTIAGTIISDTATQIVAVSPAQPSGTIVDVTVTTAGGTSATLFGDLFNYTLVAPIVSSVNPPSGPVAGGTTVTITGANLLGATEVDFGATAATIVSNSPTQIVVRTPAETAGTVDVTVVTPGERSAISANDKYTYSASIVPIVSGLSPSSGLVTGGTTVTIMGTNLSGATAVEFGSTAGTIILDSATEIEATSPAQAAGTVDVTVVTPIGTSATSPADQFTYQVPGPVVSTVSPSSGPTSGGTSVTISGSSLSGATAVNFGQTAGTITSDTATQITVTSPAGNTGAVDVTVVTAGGTSAISPYDQFNYGAAPTITGLMDGGSLIHNLGPSNTRGFGLYIFGANLNGVTEVDFGAVPGTIVDDRGTLGFIYVTTPSEGPGTVDVRVETPSGTSAITPADQFTFTAAPFVTNVANTGSSFGAGGPVAGGTSVTIQGYHLSDVTAVNFGNTPAASFTFDSYYATIAAISPPGAAGAVSVTVTSPEGTSTAAPALDQFTYYAIATVTGISPASGPLAGGNSVLITGTNLSGAEVTFGGLGVNPVGSSGTDTSILVTAPAGTSPGTVDVTVSTGGGTSATSSADQYTYLTPPVISGLSISAGPVAGGTTVTISGTGLAGATAVAFGPNNPAMILSDTDGQIVVTSPATNVAGTVDVTVTTLNGPSINSPADQFTYEGPPSIYTQDTYSGPVKGGTLVTLTGISLANASAVDFGSNPATIVSDTDQQIVIRTPEATGDAVGTVDVTVVTQYGSSPSGQFAFTYVLPPVVTGISQSMGPETGGTQVTISGSNLFGATAVDFGGTPAISFIVNGDGTITAFSPAGAGGTVDVTVVAPGGTSATPSADQFTYVGQPTVSVISPVAGPIAGGTQVTIVGTNLAGATRVDFNDGQGDDLVGAIVSDTSGQVVVTSPTFGFGGTFDVTVTTVGGTSATSPADQFTYVAAPSVSGVSPAFGNTLGSNIVTISGANLDGASAVDFGQHAGTIIYDSANQIQVVSPAGAVGSIDVTVFAPGGTSPTSSADRFLYVGAPLAMADSYSVAVGSTLTVAAAGVLANDTDPQAYSLTAELLDNPLHGALSFNSDGSFTYTPDNGYIGVDGFVYQADNGIFTSAPTLVSISVGTLTVTTAAESGPGSLRQAILDANGTPGTPHMIQFELPAGPQTINLLTPLPAATDPLTLSLDATQNVTVALSSGSTWNDNNSLTVTGAGTLAVTGGIEGTGNLTVEAGSSLTANHIVQGALVIGGMADAPAMVTIAASDASGNPLAAATASAASAANAASSSNVVSSSSFASASILATGDVIFSERLAALRTRQLAQVAVSNTLLHGGTSATAEPQLAAIAQVMPNRAPTTNPTALPNLTDALFDESAMVAAPRSTTLATNWAPPTNVPRSPYAATNASTTGFATADSNAHGRSVLSSGAIDAALAETDFTGALDESLLDLLVGAAQRFVR
jgi:hypothetical protein